MNDEFLNTDTRMFVTDGSAIRQPSGRFVCRKAESRENPSARHASTYPCSTASKPARKFSTVYAPPHNSSDSQPTVKPDSWTPTSGSAKYRKKICTSRGVLRKIST